MNKTIKMRFCFVILKIQIIEQVNKKKEERTNDICSLNCTIGLGLNPPKKYYSNKAFDNNNYIWDF